MFLNFFKETSYESLMEMPFENLVTSCFQKNKVAQYVLNLSKEKEDDILERLSEVFINDFSEHATHTLMNKLFDPINMMQLSRENKDLMVRTLFKALNKQVPFNNEIPDYVPAFFLSYLNPSQSFLNPNFQSFYAQFPYVFEAMFEERTNSHASQMYFDLVMKDIVSLSSMDQAKLINSVNQLEVIFYTENLYQGIEDKKEFALYVDETKMMDFEIRLQDKLLELIKDNEDLSIITKRGHAFESILDYIPLTEENIDQFFNTSYFNNDIFQTISYQLKNTDEEHYLNTQRYKQRRQEILTILEHFSTSFHDGKNKLEIFLQDIADCHEETEQDIESEVLGSLLGDIFLDVLELCKKETEKKKLLAKWLLCIAYDLNENKDLNLFHKASVREIITLLDEDERIILFEHIQYIPEFENNMDAFFDKFNFKKDKNIEKSRLEVLVNYCAENNNILDDNEYQEIQEFIKENIEEYYQELGFMNRYYVSNMNKLSPNELMDDALFNMTIEQNKNVSYKNQNIDYSYMNNDDETVLLKNIDLLSVLYLKFPESNLISKLIQKNHLPLNLENCEDINENMLSNMKAQKKKALLESGIDKINMLSDWKTIECKETNNMKKAVFKL